jgi:uncharacterized protein YciI
MEFVVIGYDAKDEKALERRIAARTAHLENANKLFEEKRLLFASALLDENENMNGSIMFCDFPSKETLKKDWLKHEPYIIGNVWEKVIIKRTKIAKLVG